MNAGTIDMHTALHVYWLSGLRTLGLHLYGAWDNGINVEGTHEGFWSWSRHSFLVIRLAQTQADQTNTTNMIFMVKRLAHVANGISAGSQHSYRRRDNAGALPKVPPSPSASADLESPATDERALTPD